MRALGELRRGGDFLVGAEVHTYHRAGCVRFVHCESGHDPSGQVEPALEPVFEALRAALTKCGGDLRYVDGWSSDFSLGAMHGVSQKTGRRDRPKSQPKGWTPTVELLGWEQQRRRRTPAPPLLGTSGGRFSGGIAGDPPQARSGGFARLRFPKKQERQCPEAKDHQEKRQGRAFEERKRKRRCRAYRGPSAEVEGPLWACALWGWNPLRKLLCGFPAVALPARRAEAIRLRLFRIRRRIYVRPACLRFDDQGASLGCAAGAGEIGDADGGRGRIRRLSNRTAARPHPKTHPERP